MLGIVEQILPFGSNQWNAVQLQYNTNLPDGLHARDTESLKRKFYALKNTRKPTGDPSSLVDVMQAKRVYRMIEGRCGVLVLDDATPTNPPPSSDGGAPPPRTVPSSISDENPVANSRVQAKPRLEQLGQAISDGTTEPISESARTSTCCFCRLGGEPKRDLSPPRSILAPLAFWRSPEASKCGASKAS
ncbi:unnamed protein product [Phytophthora fragariaefolia]|uniref:Unnamed protein product n=1 Tax=Phytophthora fragariaefolia TaxID=1490495 RepID=A0A9W6Y8B9_9STRA|nr:unnamed protein product [Phytophthora fragariaefolia]